MAKAITHHNIKEIFDGLHDNLETLKYATIAVNDDANITSEEKEVICESVNKLRALLIELECDFTI
ncbi:MAG: hypothetical protein JXA54_16100 [Candidatus Heimdallarchaeota archaeon]|nr:hypothetical protein [Candidatus Heimdallarchaeota archaeon]